MHASHSHIQDVVALRTGYLFGIVTFNSKNVKRISGQEYPKKFLPTKFFAENHFEAGGTVGVTVTINDMLV